MALGNGTDINEILPAYRPESLPAGRELPEIGQIVATVVPHFQPPLEIYDVTRADHQNHAEVRGLIRTVREGDFRPKPDRLPIFTLRLGECEELLAIRAKVRPCVVLATADGVPDAHLPPTQRNIARPAFGRPSFLVAPAFSVATADDNRAVSTTIAARAECLVYPQLMFLPRSGGYITQDSVVRLDRAFWTTLPSPTELYRIAISDERMSILAGQLQVLRGLAPPQEYLELVDLVRGELSDDHARDLP